ncbi:MAG: hypothetical protein CMJ83_02735 [Planctomycetes bacterium]|jgi:putative glutamine amidotransferase|nr:hypothetical protein [Planctomycetota bacterium]
MTRPVIGLTADLRDDCLTVGADYVRAIERAGGDSMILPVGRGASALAERCDGVLFTGGRDPATEAFGQSTHPAARLMDPRRQESDLALLAQCYASDLPALGVCLGMQLMGLRAGARLEQHLDDVLDRPQLHTNDHVHLVEGTHLAGPVTSAHHQALATPGGLEVVARAPDGVIEAILDPSRRFWLGVQWHPERTADEDLGLGVVRRLVAAAAGQVVRRTGMDLKEGGS